MEPVTGCSHWRDALALDALSALEPDERAGLAAHLDGCAECRELARELHETAGALASADARDVGPTAAVPPALAERVLGGLHDDALAVRRRRRLTAGAGALVAASIAASLVLVLALPSRGPASPSRTESLSGGSHATATAVLTSASWGTSLVLTERGLAAGTVYEVSMRTSATQWWTTGSFRPATAGTVVARMACYVPMRSVTGLRVTDTHGHAVLESIAAPGTSW